MKKYINILLTLFFVILEIFVLSSSKIFIKNFTNSLNICLYNLMPTMFSSILFSQILIKLEFFKYIPKVIINFFKNIFNINKEDVSIFFLSIISGYPNNAKMLVNNKNLNNIIHYTNFVNPIFLVGTVGGIYLKNIKLSLIILISNYISNIIIGIVFRKQSVVSKKTNNSNNNSFLDMYYSSLKSTIYTLAIIFSNILFFSIIISLITNIIHLNEPFNSILVGLIEFSSGIYKISFSNINLFYKGLLISIIITFSSFSMHMQIMSLNDKIKYIKYFLIRIFNVFIIIIIYILFFFLFYI